MSSLRDHCPHLELIDDILSDLAAMWGVRAMNHWVWFVVGWPASWAGAQAFLLTSDAPKSLLPSARKSNLLFLVGGTVLAAFSFVRLHSPKLSRTGADTSNLVRLSVFTNQFEDVNTGSPEELSAMRCWRCYSLQLLARPRRNKWRSSCPSPTRLPKHGTL